MTLNILAAEVFDPAMSGEYDLPARLELVVDRLPTEPTYMELNQGPFSITHRNWVQTIGCDEPWWDDEDTTECAAIFNSSAAAAAREPVMPVLIASEDADGMVWQDFYVKISRVRRILNKLERLQGVQGYEVIPDPTYALEKRNGWMLQHPRRICVVCAQEAAEGAGDGGLVSLDHLPPSKYQQVRPHRVVPMCHAHRADWNENHREYREEETV
ncbi:hypothetical protein TIN2_83 [Tsukamurella phage TIN2]|uniref:Uncharacterized protein n=1 Tax=Tsukamurella phage TIN2 TaxID=1636545 RepID=A0A0K0N5J9_9CAUD|nr:hypothetical protein AVT55_gp040 [Tsukamurella phage TIN2]AKJ71773.1 hypothetical protein TIN2_83 [Tsukamurella phage TIN2]